MSIATLAPALVRRAPLLKGKPGAELAKQLRAGRVGVTPADWTVVANATGLVVGFAVTILAIPGLGLLAGVPWLLAVVAGFASGFAAFGLVRLGFLLQPSLAAKGRAGRIDAELPSVVTLCYGLARGGVPILDVFRAVADEKATYGEISREFEIVVRAVEDLGYDVPTAVLAVAETTPSDGLRRFLEGFITILNSGADPGRFLRHQAEFQLENAEAAIEKEIDLMGLLAETYVSGLLVLPLILLVVMTVLSAFSGGGATTLPAIVYGLIPVGTVGYLAIAQLLLPSESVRAPAPPPEPLDDAGFEVARGDRETIELPPLPSSTGARAALRATLKFLEDPIQAMLAGAGLALVVGVTGALVVSRLGADMITLTGLTVAVTLAFAVPAAVSQEVGQRRRRAYDRTLPGLLTKLSSLNDRGVGLARAFGIVGRAETTPLAREMLAVDRDVTWTGSLRGALRRFRARIGTPSVGRLAVLLERASRASGDLRGVIQIASGDAARRERLYTRRRQAMSSYILVVYAVFLVFLYVAATVTSLFFASTSEGAAGLGLSASSSETTRLLFLHACVLQGACCGIVAGRLGEGSLLAGVKHAAILAIIAWVAFAGGWA